MKAPTLPKIRSLVAIVFAGAAAVLAGVTLEAAPSLAREPLMQEDTQSIPQRVLSRPGATLSAERGGGTQVEQPTPFTLYYVFDRQDHDGKEWIEVGPNRNQDPLGWMPAANAVDWKQTLVLTFKNPAGRLPTLFFGDRTSLIDFVEDEQLPVLAPQYVEATRAGQPPEGSGIVSIEGEEYVDFREEFYLLPILNAEQVLLSATSQRSKIFEIASIPLKEEPPAEEEPAAEEFPVGLVFVIDTTLSMDPYINRTREAVRKISDIILQSDLADRISFGIVGFRDSIDGVEELEYTVKVFAPLTVDSDPKEFLKQIETIEAAATSSRGYGEDGLAGVLAALNQESWKEFGGRYIIFITDAPLRVPPDPRATTGLTIEAINSVARDRQIGIISLLLQTDEGTAYHRKAETQLRRLSFWRQDWATPFYAVPRGSLADFGPTIDNLTQRIVEQVSGNTQAQAGTSDDQAAAAEDCDQVANAIECLGYAMRLAWLGRTSGAQAPDVFKAWVPQFALNDPVNAQALEVRVLLTRAQVNNLYARLGLVLEAADRLVGQDPGLFFDVLQSVIAQAANDPTMLENLDPAQGVSFEVEDLPNLGGLLGEYFQHLPFKTRLMRVDREAWDRMPGSEREQILVSVRSARRLLKNYYQNSDRWIALHPQAADGEKVYPLPMEVLP